MEILTMLNEEEVIDYEIRLFGKSSAIKKPQDISTLGQTKEFVNLDYGNTGVIGTNNACTPATSGSSSPAAFN